ncbi:GCN5-related N-acetyltransferase [Ruminiclostridium papyrosolvens DSM 2782]|uniref:GCN5-related N-acetyltransferase n=1 Tax=Ruminiclostridium papyrosolvens DSM 2782 TaxID=588581 RepID=F1TE56_9FIRM|nr:N-acetyltransferase [Ruminiclostridium papyrosolvens]EGD47296.1 GCN5-related N-acetyltransferase [Ruminiclostridium papyrosolvens DSM 2782]WES34642.1 N-acetyltransferase [Ruminiclostridium papyrosolvens DSM 2782]
MIRDFKKQDLDRIMDLWLDTNISAHSFIDNGYWESNYDTVKTMMPNATIYLYEENDIIQGFVGLMDNYIAGIFVSRQVQSSGIGKKLLDYVKDKKATLSLNVYQENSRAVSFYLRESFAISNEQIDENTGKIELSMNWVK